MLGLVGGLSPYSTVEYYKRIVERGRERLGEEPEIMIYSLSFKRMCELIGEDKL